MSNVIPFNGITLLDLDPDMVLEHNKGKFEGLIRPPTICASITQAWKSHMTIAGSAIGIVKEQTE